MRFSKVHLRPEISLIFPTNTIVLLLNQHVVFYETPRCTVLKMFLSKSDTKKSICTHSLRDQYLTLDENRGNPLSALELYINWHAKKRIDFVREDAVKWIVLRGKNFATSS